ISGTAWPLPWHSYPTAVAMQCQTSGIVIPRQRENYVTEVAELCHCNGRTVRLRLKKDEEKR
ncbi:MAG: hypothetical protein IJ901_00595, partial [Bacteroidaceae bacterium]|nr:hypothetical protein [Bacteroidaceae bacterium]